jgi:hypothetical protein
MSRGKWLSAAALAVLVGCQTTPEQLKVQPLLAEGAVLTYGDAVQRARALATSATEAFYVDQWAGVESAANGLEQTAQLLPRASDMPPVRQASVAGQAAALQQDAQQLRAAASQNDEKKTNEVLQRIHLRVRELRPQ